MENCSPFTFYSLLERCNVIAGESSNEVYVKYNGTIESDEDMIAAADLLKAKGKSSRMILPHIYFKSSKEGIDVTGWYTVTAACPPEHRFNKFLNREVQAKETQGCTTCVLMMSYKVSHDGSESVKFSTIKYEYPYTQWLIWYDKFSTSLCTPESFSERMPEFKRSAIDKPISSQALIASLSIFLVAFGLIACACFACLPKKKK